MCSFSRDNPPFPPRSLTSASSSAVICLYGRSQAREIAPLGETDLPFAAAGASVPVPHFNLKSSAAPGFNCPRFPHPIGSQSVLWKRGALRTFPNEVEEKKKRERKKTHRAVSQIGSGRQTEAEISSLSFPLHSPNLPPLLLLLRSPISLSSRVLRLRIFHTARAARPAAAAILQDLSDLPPPSLPPRAHVQ